MTIVLILGLAACKGAPAAQLFRAKKVILTVEADGFSLPIPAGYRNIAELVDQDRAMRIQDSAPSGSDVVVSEQFAPERLWIAVSASPSDAGAEIASDGHCDVLSHAPAAETAIEKTPLGIACTVALDLPAEHDELLGDVPARKVRDYWLASNGKLLLLECVGPDVATRDRVCKEFLMSATAR